MKKLLSILFLFIVLVSNINAANSEETTLLTGSVTMVPKSFYGTWRVSAVKLEGNSQIFKNKTVDVWNLSRTGNVITLYNMFNGAKAEIDVNDASAKHVIFTKNGKYKQKTLTDRVEMNIDGDKFKGYDVLVIKTYVNGAVSKTDRAKYAITGEKIGGSAIIE
ncbi:MAG: hypothetical protein SPL73_05385 [Cyanobacteriota bacterium]|nr:hypothetical protein [Cyanobacteriota bacterium]MDY6357997.1 hypothetical protein [Cyanobacteriota bacterium]MDY6364303.1 hypothetical protein [Cyanobacteriota bacterium]